MESRDLASPKVSSTTSSPVPTQFGSETSAFNPVNHARSNNIGLLTQNTQNLKINNPGLNSSERVNFNPGLTTANPGLSHPAFNLSGNNASSSQNALNSEPITANSGLSAPNSGLSHANSGLSQTTHHASNIDQQTLNPSQQTSGLSHNFAQKPSSSDANPGLSLKQGQGNQNPGLGQNQGLNLNQNQSGANPGLNLNQNQGNTGLNLTQSQSNANPGLNLNQNQGNTGLNLTQSQSNANPGLNLNQNQLNPGFNLSQIQNGAANLQFDPQPGPSHVSSSPFNPGLSQSSSSNLSSSSSSQSVTSSSIYSPQSQNGPVGTNQDQNRTNLSQNRPDLAINSPEYLQNVLGVNPNPSNLSLSTPNLIQGALGQDGPKIDTIGHNSDINRANTDGNRPNSSQNRTGLDQMRSGLDQNRSGLDQNRSGLDQNRSGLGRTGLDQHNPGLNQHRSGLDQSRPGLNQGRPGLDQNLGLNGPDMANRPNFEQNRALPYPGLNRHNPELNRHNPELNRHNPDLNIHNPDLNRHDPSLNRPNPGLNAGLNRPNVEANRLNMQNRLNQDQNMGNFNPNRPGNLPGQNYGLNRLGLGQNGPHVAQNAPNANPNVPNLVQNTPNSILDASNLSQNIPNVVQDTNDVRVGLIEKNKHITQSLQNPQSYRLNAGQNGSNLDDYISRVGPTANYGPTVPNLENYAQNLGPRTSNLTQNASNLVSSASNLPQNTSNLTQNASNLTQNASIPGQNAPILNQSGPNSMETASNVIPTSYGRVTPNLAQNASNLGPTTSNVSRMASNSIQTTSNLTSNSSQSASYNTSMLQSSNFGQNRANTGQNLPGMFQNQPSYGPTTSNTANLAFNLGKNSSNLPKNASLGQNTAFNLGAVSTNSGQVSTNSGQVATSLGGNTTSSSQNATSLSQNATSWGQYPTGLLQNKTNLPSNIPEIKTNLFATPIQNMPHPTNMGQSPANMGHPPLAPLQNKPNTMPPRSSLAGYPQNMGQNTYTANMAHVTQTTNVLGQNAYAGGQRGPLGVPPGVAGAPTMQQAPPNSSYLPNSADKSVLHSKRYPQVQGSPAGGSGVGMGPGGPMGQQGPPNYSPGVPTSSQMPNQVPQQAARKVVQNPTQPAYNTSQYQSQAYQQMQYKQAGAIQDAYNQGYGTGSQATLATSNGFLANYQIRRDLPYRQRHLNDKIGVVQTGFNRLWGTDSVIDLLQTPNVLPQTRGEPPRINLGQEEITDANCSPEIFRCTLTKMPETNSLLQKSRLPLGVLIHPFKDLNNLPVIQCTTIVRCRACRTYINPFVFFVDSKRWKCNLCYRVSDLPDEFLFDPVSKTYGDPSRRPEVRSSTIEYIAPAEYMLRPPQPAIYLFLLDVSRSAVESGYLQSMCNILSNELANLPGDSRTQIGFIAFNTNLHFYNLGEGYSQPKELTVLDINDVFLPCPDNLLVNLKDRLELIQDLLLQLPTRFNNTYDNNSCLGAALQASLKLIGVTGGRVTVFQCSLPNLGPGSLTPREDPSLRSSAEVQHLNPANDFYKRLALDFSAQQVAVDLFVLNSMYVDFATISGVSRFSGGCLHHIPLFKVEKTLQSEYFERSFKRYLTRKIGFEAVMRLRCTRGLAIHTFHGNFFVRSTDLLSLPNINPDAGFGMQVSIEESLADLQRVCFQAALLYTSSKGERRIRVHTLCIPVTNNLTEIMQGADQECIVGLLAKMAVDRSMQSSLNDAREAFLNVAIDILSSYKLAQNMGNSSSLIAPNCLKLLPLYISALLKHTAFRIGTNTRLDDRIKAMCDMKTKPLNQLIQFIYPDLYPVHNLGEFGVVLNEEEEPVHFPPLLQLSARSLDSKGVYLMDLGEHIIILVCQNVSGVLIQNLFEFRDYQAIPDGFCELPLLQNEFSLKLNAFVNFLNQEKPFPATIQILRDDSMERHLFFQCLIEDRLENALSYHEFLQHLKAQLK